MANVLFNKCVASLPDFPTPKDKYDSLAPHDAGTFYLVGDELYLGDVLLSATMAEEIGVLDTAGYFDGANVEAVLAELHDLAEEKNIWFHDDSAGQSQFAKVYHLYQGANDFVPDRTDGKTNPTLIGTIETAKDLVVKAGSVVEVFFDETDNTLHEGSIGGTDITDLIIPEGGTATAANAGKYIKLEIQNQDDPIYIAVKDLVDVYTGGATAEATVAIDGNNVITVTINKVVATKIIYQEAAEAVLYTQDEYDAYVAEHGVAPDWNVGDVKIPAVPEINIKAKVDQVETDLNALADYVGEIPATSEATTVIDYVDEKTGEGVGALNSEAGIASVESNVVTIKGGVVETEGLIANSAATAPATTVDGYYNPADGKFYEDAGFVTEITPADNTAYVDQAVGGKTYVWTGKKFAEVRPDIVLEEVAVTGAAGDVSIADAGSYYTGETAEAALQEIGAKLSWQEV